jgi:vesicle coat complex subunit
MFMTGTPGADLFLMAILALPVACVAWTVTHEEVFREPREYCIERSKVSRRLVVRKFFYLFTCEYCFSHYVTLATLLATNATLLFDDWRGSVLAFFTIVWIANQYMSLFARLRLDITRERVEIDIEEKANTKEQITLP